MNTLAIPPLLPERTLRTSLASSAPDAHGVAPGGGLDYWMKNDRVSVRVVDFEYQIWPQFTFGTLHPYGVSAGISLHIW